MKHLIRTLLVGAAGVAFLPLASATVLGFDDLGADGLVPAHYGGLDWSGSDWFAFGEAQDPYTAHSGDFRVTSGFGDADAATAIKFGTAAVFDGAWFAGLSGATVTFDLYYHGQQVATSATLDPSATPAFLGSGYKGLVDEVIVASPGQGSYVMDDFTFTQAVPEPETYALMLAGLGVVGMTLRRTRDARA
jgi:hypothetical protein